MYMYICIYIYIYIYMCVCVCVCVYVCVLYMDQHKPVCNLFNLSEETYSWSTVIPEGLIVTQRFKKFPTFYDIRIHIATFAEGRTYQLPSGQVLETRNKRPQWASDWRRHVP